MQLCLRSCVCVCVLTWCKHVVGMPGPDAARPQRPPPRMMARGAAPPPAGKCALCLLFEIMICANISDCVICCVYSRHIMLVDRIALFNVLHSPVT